MLATILTVALVVQDQTPLRATAQDAATRQAVLWQGEWLEVRGERQGFLQVYDHRRERPGYVRENQVRVYPLDETSVPQLQAVVEFLKDTPGAEALGIGYTAALLRAAPPSAVGPELFDAMGTFSERLARRASVRKSLDETLAAHLEVAASYGVKLSTLETEDRTRLCYDGEAFRRLLALGGTPRARLRAALALTQDGVRGSGDGARGAPDDQRVEGLGAGAGGHQPTASVAGQPAPPAQGRGVLGAGLPVVPPGRGQAGRRGQ